MTWKSGIGLVACALLTACGGGGGRPHGAADTAQALNWRRVATVADRQRLSGWRTAWTTALAKVRAAGSGNDIAAQGALFEPDQSRPGAMPPAGAYRCRTFKLGANGTAMRDLTVYPYFGCRIEDEGDVASFYKTGGSQRPVGLLFKDGSARGVFLGTMMLGDERTALQYGRDASRDMAGIVERVGDARWRIVMPYPRFESVLDVVEVVPAG